MVVCPLVVLAMVHGATRALAHWTLSGVALRSALNGGVQDGPDDVALATDVLAVRAGDACCVAVGVYPLAILPLHLLPAVEETCVTLDAAGLLAVLARKHLADGVRCSGGVLHGGDHWCVLRVWCTSSIAGAASGVNTHYVCFVQFTTQVSCAVPVSCTVVPCLQV
jgi:hypothetical protein